MVGRLVVGAGLVASRSSSLLLDDPGDYGDAIVFKMKIHFWCRERRC